MAVLPVKVILAGLIALAAAGGVATYVGGHAGTGDVVDRADGRVALTITGAGAGTGSVHVFHVEPARTAAEQQQGLMYRTDLKPDGGMIFAPYPAGGGGPVEASFWMKNTPSPLDIVFIRADGTIARIAENTVPFSETPVPSGEPVAAVLEIMGGRTAELGIAAGDRVTWAGFPK